MQYSMEEIATFLANPTYHKEKYSQALLDELIEYLYPPEERDDVREYLTVIPEHLPLRIHLAVVHLSASKDERGSITRLLGNIDLVQIDYRDLLMAYYD